MNINSLIKLLFLVKNVKKKINIYKKIIIRQKKKIINNN